MSADPRDLFHETARLSEAVTRPFPGSTKLQVATNRPDLTVTMRQVSQSATPSEGGSLANPPIVMYDTSGPYTDPEADIDLCRGLAPTRGGWIEERGDTEPLDGRSASYARERLADRASA